MHKRTIVRLQLFALFVVMLLLLYRVIEGPPAPQGDLVLADLEVEQLRHAALRLNAPDTLLIQATGSFEQMEGKPTLAAYGWILRRADRTVAWKMDASRARRVRGTLAETVDTLFLAEGLYDVYFTSFGERRNGGSLFERFTQPASAWRNDSRKWNLVVRSLTQGHGRLERVEDEEDAALAPGGDLLVWTSAPMEGYSSVEQLFELRRPARVRLYAIGEIGETQMDYGWIEDIATGERVWEMRLDNTVPAGGWEVNRLYDGMLTLNAGIYRVVYQTDPRQSYDDWVANPPFDPAAWGLSIFAATPPDREAVAAFDPWRSRRPLVQFSEVGNETLCRARLDVHQPIRVLAYAVGEIGSNPYDFAWVRADDSEETIWEMSESASRPAGGDDNNRQETAFLELAPGRYTLGYQTDESHAYGHWLHGEPDHPERWGVTLFPLAEHVDTSAVQVVAQACQRGDDEGMPEMPEVPGVPDGPPPPPPPALGTGTNLLQAIRLGAEVRKEMPFTLNEPSNLHIYALGEISLSGRYDYGWIERAGDGEIVWEMTWQNTQPAGGDDRNRLFDGVIKLPPGRYVAHFRTDFSHNFGAFGDRAPENAEAWGITIEKL